MIAAAASNARDQPRPSVHICTAPICVCLHMQQRRLQENHICRVLDTLDYGQFRFRTSIRSKKKTHTRGSVSAEKKRENREQEAHKIESIDRSDGTPSLKNVGEVGGKTPGVDLSSGGFVWRSLHEAAVAWNMRFSTPFGVVGIFVLLTGS